MFPVNLSHNCNLDEDAFRFIWAAIGIPFGGPERPIQGPETRLLGDGVRGYPPGLEMTDEDIVVFEVSKKCSLLSRCLCFRDTDKVKTVFLVLGYSYQLLLSAIYFSVGRAFTIHSGDITIY